MDADTRIERARAGARLLLITDRGVPAAALADAVSRALDGGVSAVMLREHDLGREALLELGRPLARACRERGALFLVNHAVDAVAALDADGVHLGFRSPDVAQARAIVGEGRLVGASTHDAAELARAVDDGADYVTFSPIYDTPSKRGLVAPRGTAALAQAVSLAAPVPVVALGGIDVARVADVRRTGAAGIACIRAVLAAGDPREAATALRSAWEAAA